MSMELILGLAIGAVLGAVVGWLVCQSRLTKEQGRLREALARLEAQLEAERKRFEDSQKVLNEAEARFRETFQALSSEALKSNNQAFLDLAKTSLGEFQKMAVGDLDARQKAIGDLVKPVEKSLDEVQRRIQEVEKQRIEAYSGLKQHLETMSTAQQQLQSETGNLVKALRSPTVRGRWGEIQLKRVVEMAGMLEYCDFVEQETVQTDDGRLRPDLIVRLPGGKNVVVDAKAPLAAYLESIEAADDTVRELELNNHARQVRDHMTALSSKGYWSQFEPAPEFVVMFLPGEAFFSAALQQDASLIEYGVEQRVIPASPTTLIALLRAVAYGWRQETLAENAQAISDLGRDLYDRIRVWAEHLGKVGKGLEQAVGSYNSSIASLESRVLVSARRFTDLGVSAKEAVKQMEPVDQVPREVAAVELKQLYGFENADES